MMSINLRWGDFERANICPFKVMSRNSQKITLTRLWTCQYQSIQSDVKRFVKICIDRILKVPILVYSMWCQEICKDLHWQDFERANIGPFNCDVNRFVEICIDRTLNVPILAIQSDVKRIVEVCIDKTLNVQILVYSKWCQEIRENLYWRDFKHANIGLFKAMSREL